MITIGVFASIFNEAGEVLCVRRNYAPYGWTTPGGRLEDDESPEDGVVREVLEETGYHVSIERLVGIYSAPYKSDLVISFVCSIIGRDPWLPNDEIAEVGFFSMDALPQPMRANTQVRISDAGAREQVFFRTFKTAEPGRS